MNKTIILFLAVIFAISCGKNQNEEIFRAEVNGESWKASRIVTRTNDVGEVISIEGFGPNNSRMLFTLLDMDLNTPSSDFPVDADGNSIVSNIHLTIVPDLVQIRYHLEVLGALADVDRVVFERSADGENFTGFHQITFDGRSSFTESWVDTNDQVSSNDYVVYRYKLIYNTNQAWYSSVQLGTTSFRGEFDNGLTENQETGEFTLTQYDRNKRLLSGEFSFDTATDQIRNGELIDISY